MKFDFSKKNVSLKKNVEKLNYPIEITLRRIEHLDEKHTLWLSGPLWIDALNYQKLQWQTQ